MCADALIRVRLAARMVAVLYEQQRYPAGMSRHSFSMDRRVPGSWVATRITSSAFVTCGNRWLDRAVTTGVIASLLRAQPLCVYGIGGVILKNARITNEFNGIGGRGGIRTHGTVSRTPVFKTGSLNHSDTLPGAGSSMIGVADVRGACG